ncbi:MAG: GNAT family N-acetyltransferase [Xanthomonadales bacterium]|nr:GNAT family N-acetyltransferase [Xanthomonadales bacterium]
MNNISGKINLQIRLIEPQDNAEVADIIRLVMTEFEAVGCGYSINDAEIDDMHSAYAPQNSRFYVVVLDGKVRGCGGFAPLNGGEEDTCELRKMYFRAELRGLGVGTQLLELCLEKATRAGFRYCYLETMDGMQQAQRLYGKYGFKYLDKPMGDTGHGSCGTWMARAL